MEKKQSLQKNNKRLTIIIPIFNDLERLEKVLDSLERQISDDKSVEVFVVDNNSTVDVKSFCEKYLFVHYILEDKNLNSPYSCRNRGLERAEGSIIAFIDATCIPDGEWLRNGLQNFVDKQEKIVAGNVVFELDHKSTLANILDGLISVQMESAVKNHKWAFTANLWASKSLFNTYGKFPEGIRSGGDVRWTKKLTNDGVIIEYDENCIIYKSTREWNSLKKKKWRTAIYQTQKWIDLNARLIFLRHIRAFLKLIFIPPGITDLNVRNRLSIEVYNANKSIELKLWVLRYYLNIIEAFGIISGGLRWLLRI